jgi:hypothetical protein
MSLTDYTTPASVRAILGVSDKEITDPVLLDPIFRVTLTEQLNDLSPALLPAYLALKDLTTNTGPQTRYVDVFQSYAAYLVAQQLVGSAAMFAPQIIKDTKTELARTLDAHKGLRDAIAGSLDYLRGRLLDSYAVLTAGTAKKATARTLVLNSALGLNPVTG